MSEDYHVTGTYPASYRFRRTISYGDDHHQRAECLEREGQWCRGIGGHPGRCSSCPIEDENYREMAGNHRQGRPKDAAEADLFNRN